MSQGPRRTVELDDDSAEEWVLDSCSAYIWEGRLWRKDIVGCVLCVEADKSSTLVRTDDDGQEHFVCQQHGPLGELKYEMVKQYTVTIGGVVREGEERVNDSMLFPASMSAEEKDDLINKLLDEADREEQEVGVES